MGYRPPPRLTADQRRLGMQSIAEAREDVRRMHFWPPRRSLLERLSRRLDPAWWERFDAVSAYFEHPQTPL